MSRSMNRGYQNSHTHSSAMSVSGLLRGPGPQLRPERLHRVGGEQERDLVSYSARTSSSREIQGQLTLPGSPGKRFLPRGPFKRIESHNHDNRFDLQHVLSTLEEPK